MVLEKDQPLTRKRVLYIGSSVPLETSDGLEAIQQPLRDLYQTDEKSSVDGWMSFLSILPTGLQLQCEGEPTPTWFPITSLSLCAAVRCITTINSVTGEKVAKFVSLSSPAAGGANEKRPAIFTAITRRTQGKKLLYCHGFLCSQANDALELVQATFFADKTNKSKMNGSIVHPHAPLSQTRSTGYESVSLSENITPRSTSSSEQPLHIISGENQNGGSIELNGNPPQQGYFYSSKPQNVKKYVIEKLADEEPERQPLSPHPVSPPPPQVQQVFPARPPSVRTMNYSRAPTVASMPVGSNMTLPPPRTNAVPMRVVPMPRMVSPPVVAVRPRFFSPPPPMVRPRVVVRPRDPFVFMPPPPPQGYMHRPLIMKQSQHRHGSESSRSHSSGSSSPRNLHDETFPKRAMNGDGDASSEVSSRPRTPPTDYEGKPPGLPRTRISRREQFELRQRHHNATLPPEGYYQHPPMPYDYYVYPPNRMPYQPFYATRPRSVPPTTERGKGKNKDKKKNRKGKDKKHKRKVYGAPSDVSTDSVGYQSEIPSNLMDRSSQKMPRDFRRLENQHKNERAFSGSLAKGERFGTMDENRTAYSLNAHMAERADGEFNLY